MSRRRPTAPGQEGRATAQVSVEVKGYCVKLYLKEEITCLKSRLCMHVDVLTEESSRGGGGVVSTGNQLCNIHIQSKSDEHLRAHW